MPGFRLSRLACQPGGEYHHSLDELRRIIAEVVQPGQFYVASPLELNWQKVEREVVSWEVLRSRLLDRAQTRLERSFEAWNVFTVEHGTRSDEPLLSVKLDAEAGQIHVVRAIYSYAWEGYHAGNDVYLSRETQKWVRELVGSIAWKHFSDLPALRDELIALVFHAVIGSSRLPLTSVEAPLPAFSLGLLGYYYRPSAGDAEPPLSSVEALIQRALTPELNELERTKLLENVLRAAPATELESVVECYQLRWQAIGGATEELPALMRRLFDEVALSPLTGFIESALRFLVVLEAKGALSADAVTDFLSYLMRHLVRHLTAYDLITFHHQGANYPDALLLDAALRSYLERIEREPFLFLPADTDDGPTQTRKRLRRRALRQAWLLRRFYEGLPVPDTPTTPGENARILPPPHMRVPEEQILAREKRTKRLFVNDPLPQRAGPRAHDALRLSLRDLTYPSELRELGTALFLDRPFGVGKAATEPDQTLLLAYEAFSRLIASRHLRYLADDLGLLPATERDALLATLKCLPVRGVPLPLARGAARPGSVSLDDARKMAADFVFLRTTRHSVQQLLEQFDFSVLEQRLPLDFVTSGQSVLVMRDDVSERLAVYDADSRKRLELEVRAERGYACRGGREYPVSGLCAVLGTERHMLPPR
jgi:hypothetical protein